MIEPTIRDSVPLPERGGPGRKPSDKWLFVYELEPGQSAFFWNEQFDSADELKKFRQRLSAVASQLGKRSDKRFKVRTTPAGVGVWREE